MADKYRLTTATRKLMEVSRRGKRIKAVAGGTSAGKTISILQVLMDKAQSNKSLLISVVSESLPHLKRGAIRDFISILETQGYYRESNWNRTDFIYTFETGSRIEFFGVDAPDKVRGPRRDILFMNEANNCPYESFEQLEVRTKKEIWLDWNPTSEFWYYSDFEPFREDIDFLTLTYKDNEALEKSIVQSIESRKHNKAWWQVYGLGQLGEVGGRIYTGWNTKLDAIPHEARLERRGLDFGYSNDPAVLVDLYYYNGGYIFDEQVYQTRMSNRRMADYILATEVPHLLVVADSAEPKSIDEMSEYGVNIIGANKGPGSRNQGIQYVQDQKVSLTKRSVNLIKSYRNYMWKFDKNGKQLDLPDHRWSDGMDACFPAGTKVKTNQGDKNIESIRVGDRVLTRKGYRKVLSAGLTGENKPLYELKYGKYNLRATSNHPIWTENRGWVKLRDIRYADKLVIWKQLEPTGTRSITSIQNQNSSTGAGIFITNQGSYTDTSMKITLEKFQKVCMSIIRTTTSLITDQKTLNYSLIPSMAGDTGRRNNLLLSFATNAGTVSTTITDENKTDSAQINARVRGAGKRGWTISHGNVLGVGRIFKHLNLNKLRPAPDPVPIVKELKIKQNVYNLEVEGEHEYFANGILVHNCRYALESMRPQEEPDEVYSSGNAMSLWNMGQ